MLSKAPSENPDDYVRQLVLLARPCDPPCNGCKPQVRNATGYLPPSGKEKLWACERQEERRKGLPQYLVVDLDGYLPPDLAQRDRDAAAWSFWPQCDCCDLSGPQLNFIRGKHPGMDLYPWGDPVLPQKQGVA